MAAKIITIAETMKDDLNAETFSIRFTAKRKYLPTYKLEDMGCLHVTVVPRTWNAEMATRVTDDVGYTVDVAVLKKLDNADSTEEIDGLMILCQEIMDYFKRYEVTGYGVCIARANEPIYSPEHLEQLRQFTSVMTITFRKVF